MKRILYTIWQCTWGLPQTLIGFLFFLMNVSRRHIVYQGAIVTRWNLRGSISLGLFIFLDIPGDEPKTEAEKQLLRHEYGHTIQSLLLGPLFLIVIGLPSLIWAQFFNDYRRKHKISYNWLYTESWATSWGEIRWRKQKIKSD